MAIRSVTGCAPHNGFTLVEMALVVAIIGVLLTMGISTLSVQYDAAAISATQKKQEAIKDALVAYLRTNKRLPCPETTGLGGAGNAPTGRETRSSMTGTPPQPDTTKRCASYVGTLPWLDLGVSKDIALDGYGNFFTYYAASAQTKTQPDWARTHDTPNAVAGFNVGNLGRFDVFESGSGTISGTGTYYDAVPPLAAVVLVSHGKNGFGAIAEKGTLVALPATPNACEQANTPPAATALPVTSYPEPTKTLYATTNPSSTCPTGYDDIVMVLRPNDLLTPIIKDGAMKSTDALTQEQLAVVRDTAIGEMISNGCVPKSSLSATLPDDAWGSQIRYNRKNSDQLTGSLPLPDKSAFQVWSIGQDRHDDSGSGNDVVLPTGLDVTFGQIRARFPTSCP